MNEDTNDTLRVVMQAALIIMIATIIAAAYFGLL